jgi:hypothetical protein
MSMAALFPGGTAAIEKSHEEDRIYGRFYEQGKEVDTPYPEFIKSLGEGDVILKGGNAVDPAGNVGVLLSNDAGGGVGAMFGVASARGISVISAIGLEKQVASVPEAAAGWGQLTLDYAMGIRVGMASLTSVQAVTEIEALALLAGSGFATWLRAVSGGTRERSSSCWRERRSE